MTAGGDCEGRTTMMTDDDGNLDMENQTKKDPKK